MNILPRNRLECGPAGGWRRMALVVVLAAILPACDKLTETAKTYPVTPTQAWVALVDSKIPGTAFGERAHGVPAAGTADRVMWAIVAEPTEALLPARSPPHVVMRLTATLTAVADGTQVTVDILPPEGVDPAKIKELDSKLPEVAHLWRAIASEQVDSVLTQRAFDLAKIRMDMAAAVVSQVPQISKAMEEAGKAQQQREQEKIDRAYANDGHGGN
jgi:hypothetical protein